MGITDITIVPEQEYPNGYFTTCPYPNPEIFEALKYGLELAKEVDADLMLATDPDADRVGIAMRCPDGSYELVSGNEMGVLLLDYICAGRIEKGTMPKNPVAVMSIVSTPLADAVAAHYGVELRHVLTGFKWIGDQIARLEAAGEVDRFIFGFEESYGYLAGPYVRDKDAVIASMLICEMAAYYRSIGSSIKQRMEEIYAQYGRYLNKVDSFEFPGLSGMDKMAGIMKNRVKTPRRTLPALPSRILRTATIPHPPACRRQMCLSTVWKTVLRSLCARPAQSRKSRPISPQKAMTSPRHRRRKTCWQKPASRFCPDSQQISLMTGGPGSRALLKKYLTFP